MVGLQKQLSSMGSGLESILTKFGGPSTSDVLTMPKKVILLIFSLAGTLKTGFSSKKTPKPRKTGARPDFLGPLGCPAMEKNKKTSKYSGSPWAGFQGTKLFQL